MRRFYLAGNQIYRSSSIHTAAVGEKVKAHIARSVQ